MSDSPAKTMPPARSSRVPGAALLTFAGVAAAFGLASCCALPLLLTTLGLGTAWLGGVALLAAPHRALFLGVSGLCLLGGGVLLWRQQRAVTRCERVGLCTPPAVRMLTLVGLLLGAGLLWAGYAYA